MKSLAILLSCISSLAARILIPEPPSIKSVPRLARRRMNLEHSCAAQQKLSEIPGCGGICSTLAGAAIQPLLAGSGACAQMRMADKIIDTSTDASFNLSSEVAKQMVDLAVEYRQCERNAHPQYSPLAKLNSLYCREFPKNGKLNFLNQAQDPANDPNLFFDPHNPVNTTLIRTRARLDTFPFTKDDHEVGPEAGSTQPPNSTPPPTATSTGSATTSTSSDVKTANTTVNLSSASANGKSTDSNITAADTNSTSNLVTNTNNPANPLPAAETANSSAQTNLGTIGVASSLTPEGNGCSEGDEDPGEETAKTTSLESVDPSSTKSETNPELTTSETQKLSTASTGSPETTTENTTTSVNLESTSNNDDEDDLPQNKGPSSTTQSVLASTTNESDPPNSITPTGENGASTTTTNPSSVSLSSTNNENPNTPETKVADTNPTNESSTVLPAGTEANTSVTPSSDTGASTANGVSLESSSSESCEEDETDKTKTEGLSTTEENQTSNTTVSTASDSDKKKEDPPKTSDGPTLDVSKLPKECQDMRIEFGTGFKGRPTEHVYHSMNSIFEHGGSLNIVVNTEFMCDEIVNGCSIPRDSPLQKDCVALSKHVGSGKGNASKADEWNLGCGFTTTYATNPASGAGTGGAGNGISTFFSGAKPSSSDNTTVANTTPPVTSSGSLTVANTSASNPTVANTVTTGNAETSGNSTNSQTSQNATGSLPTNDKLIDTSKFNKTTCSDMRIEFGKNFPHREPKDITYEPFDLSNHYHGAAGNFAIVAQFMCDEIHNKCSVGNGDPVYDDCLALIKSIGPGKGEGSKADRWNKAFGYLTNYNDKPAQKPGGGGSGQELTTASTTDINTSATQTSTNNPTSSASLTTTTNNSNTTAVNPASSSSNNNTSSSSTGGMDMNQMGVMG